MSEQTETRCSRQLPRRTHSPARETLQADVDDLRHMLRRLRAARRGLLTVDVEPEGDE